MGNKQRGGAVYARDTLRSVALHKAVPPRCVSLYLTDQLYHALTISRLS